MPATTAALVGTAALLGCAALDPQQWITVYKVANTECVQATIGRKFGEWSLKLAGLEEGSCKDKGFDGTAEGTRALELPALGRVSVELYKKADVIDLAASLGAQVLGFESGTGTNPCCRACRPEEAKYRSVDSARGTCSESCLSFGNFLLSKAFDENLTLASSQGCSAFGFSSWSKSVKRGLPVLSVDMDVYVPPQQGTAVLHKLMGGTCSQVTVEEKSVDPAMAAIVGLEKGGCMDLGFAESSGRAKVNVPVLGDLDVALFKRAGDLNMVDALRLALTVITADMVTLYKVGGGMCGQATLDRKYEKPAESFAGLKEGSCDDQGYTQPAGSKEISVPVLGSIKISLFKKAALLGNTVTLYRIGNGMCGQASLDRKYETYVERFAGLQEGSCKDHSYTEPAGSKDLKVPVLGKIEVKLFKKAAPLQDGVLI